MQCAAYAQRGNEVAIVVCRETGAIDTFFGRTDIEPERSPVAAGQNGLSIVTFLPWQSFISKMAGVEVGAVGNSMTLPVFDLLPSYPTVTVPPKPFTQMVPK